MLQNRKYVIESCKDLDVYQKAYQTSLEIHRLSLTFPKIEQYGGLGDQMLRAGKSICANLAEGFAKKRNSAPEFRRFMSMSIGSSDEMQVWLDYARDLQYIEMADFERLAREYKNISRMLVGLQKSWIAKVADYQTDNR